jgi:hypothetical protein
MDPLRLANFTSGPPPATEPTTFRLDTEPWTDAPMTLTEPDPLLASSVNGTEDSVAMSMPLTLRRRSNRDGARPEARRDRSALTAASPG